MPRDRPPTSGYARIAQAEVEEEEADLPFSDNDDPFQDPPTLSKSAPSYAPVQPSRRERVVRPDDRGSPHQLKRRRTNSGVDIKAINLRLEKWAEEIKDKFKIRRVKGKSAAEEKLEIYSSVFQAPEDTRPATKSVLENDYDDSSHRLSKLEFDDLVESVRTAIELGVHPTLISQGSSGSYFARNSGGKVLGVFKPKDEEPYASKNPKWTKWIHRNLFPFAFGRACLIPNLSYVSEAAAYILDCQLRTNIVPYTDVVSLSSKSFHYDYFERRAFYRKRKPFPEKPGSFQVFLKGFKGATEFFKEHPWPDQHGTFQDTTKNKNRRRRWENCRPGSTPQEEYDSDDDEAVPGRPSTRAREQFWSDDLQQSFREQLEKLVILDYIMRNTDRGTDNWMIKVDCETKEASIVVEPPDPANAYSRRDERMTTDAASQGGKARPSLGAIDNSLSWPWKHPDAWRSYPFGWLFLPVSLIGRPFSEKTRKHFLPLLTSKEWWSDTQIKLRKCFEIDADFKERMYARQIAVMKGQAWNVVETLKTPDHGPLELTRRSRVLVWDDIVEVPIAVPMSRPTEETQRTVLGGAKQSEVTQNIAEDDEEMDIAAFASKATATTDLLALSPPLDPADNRFNMSRESSSLDVHVRPLVDASSAMLGTKELTPSSRKGHMRSNTSAARMSLEATRSSWYSPNERRRRFSFSMRGPPTLDEEEDGDLGYAAAQDMESRTRKVFVERLEMVKTKPPVFTWC